MDAVMRHHRADWRVERVGLAVIAIILMGALLGVFGDGPLSHGRSGSGQAVSVEYERLLRASAPTQYRFHVDPSLATQGILDLRMDNSLVDLMQVDSIVPEPERQTAGPTYTAFSFRVEPGTSPASVVFQFRPATFGRHEGQVVVPGAPALSIDHFIFP